MLVKFHKRLIKVNIIKNIIKVMVSFINLKFKKG